MEKMSSFGNSDVRLVDKKELERIMSTVNVGEVWIRDASELFVPNLNNKYAFVSDTFARRTLEEDNFVDAVRDLLNYKIHRVDLFSVHTCTKAGPIYEMFVADWVCVYKDGKWLI